MASGLNRRAFIIAVGGGIIAARHASAASVGRVGVQLYTVRSVLEKEFDATLAKVAAIGYKEVEFAGYFGHTPRQVRGALRRHALAAPSAHIEYGSLTGDKWRRVLDAARIIGHQYLVNAWVEEPLRKQPDAWKKIADTFNAAGAAAKKQGIQFCYHNHNFEFSPAADLGGKLPFDYLLDACDPALVRIELDLCWISAAGKDPLDYFQRYPGRFPLVHVKGLRRIPAASGDTPVPIDDVLPDLTDVGHDDVIDWTRIFARSQAAGIRHYFVEHDVPKDPFASLKASYDYVANLKF